MIWGHIITWRIAWLQELLLLLLLFSTENKSTTVLIIHFKQTLRRSVLFALFFLYRLKSLFKKTNQQQQQPDGYNCMLKIESKLNVAVWASFLRLPPSPPSLRTFLSPRIPLRAREAEGIPDTSGIFSSWYGMKRKEWGEDLGSSADIWKQTTRISNSRRRVGHIMTAKVLSLWSGQGQDLELKLVPPLHMMSESSQLSDSTPHMQGGKELPKKMQLLSPAHTLTAPVQCETVFLRQFPLSSPP